MITIPCVLLLLSLLVAAFGGVALVHAKGLQEHERVAEYHKRNYTWPIQRFVPNTPGWRRLNEHRLRQIAEIRNSKDRYEAYVQTIQMAMLAPNFTEYGFGLVRAPDDLMDALREGIRDGLEKGPRTEREIEVIDTAEPSWFIHRPDLIKRVLEELQIYTETWANTELTPYIAYGFRLYRNNSKLQMHVDKSSTHVVSFILHIDSSEDAEPWPIVIEDFHGNTHEVILTSGDVLLYESSKCLHGRPHRFNGSWYSSVFGHYYPKYGWTEVDHTLEKHYSIPPQWREDPTTQYEIPLQMIGTGMMEPSCPKEWCQTKYSKKWSGPGKEGILMTPGGEEVPFEPKPVLCEDKNPMCPEWVSWTSNECKRNSKFMLHDCKKSCGHCTIGMGVTEE
jgi:hypothetical protein